MLNPSLLANPRIRALYTVLFFIWGERPSHKEMCGAYRAFYHGVL